MAKVYLIGAGPGDPGLLTVRAKELLERAEVVVYDYLANKSFLRYCRPDAEIIYVGKKGGDHTLPQDKINALLVEKVKEGKDVARLKGGDPYVFGRGAEEAQELIEAGADFEVVPGVTSAVAAPAYAGIPLTHRKYASSVSFITGHEDPTKPDSSHNWQALAQAASTLVFFMGVKNLPEISANLIKHGRPASTPAALVRWGTTCRHRSLVSTLENIAADAAKHGFAAPSLLVVGEVVCLRDELNWFEKRPLLGKGVVVTRSREQASELTRQLEEAGACCLEFPTIAIKPLDNPEIREAVTNLFNKDWVIFTSVNGVRCLFEIIDDMGLDSRVFGGLRLAAIGPATAQALAERGLKADFLPEKYVAESVVQGLLDLGIAGTKVLIPRALKAREVLPEELAKAGARVTVLPVYETTPGGRDPVEVLQGIENNEIHYITFTSSSTVDNFFSLVKPEQLAPYRGRVKLVSIGPVTSSTLEKYGFSPDVTPGEYTIPALAKALIDDAKAD